MRTAFIIEDNNLKCKEIERALKAPLALDIHSTPSIAQAYRALVNKEWDLVVLDMTFQVSQGGGREIAKEALAGVEILQFMARRRILSPVIVATQHTSFVAPGLPAIDSIEGLHALLTRLFPLNYRDTIHVDLSEESWKARLRLAASAAIGEQQP